MRLLIATPLYPPDLGGPATYTKLLEQGLESQGFEAPIIVKFGDVRHYSKIIRHVMYFLQVHRAAKHADIILALDPFSVGLPALMAARFRRKKFIVKIVGDYAWEQGVQRFAVKDSLDDFVRRGRVPVQVAFLRSVQTHVAKSAQKILVPSEYLKGIITAWGVQAEKIEVIYNSIELEESGKIPEVVSKLSRPKIVSVGRLVPWKGMTGVIDSVSEISGASLVIVGDGPERSALEKHAQKILGARAVCTGALSHADVLATIADADVFVLNSTYEGLSHVLIEALMLGKAVVATRAGGNGELNTDGTNGLLVPVRDTPALTAAISQVLSDDSVREQLGSNARTSSERFKTATMLEKTAVFLNAL
jgi:glycosyltransferase involved in cell wall biosynthesis